MNMHINTKKIIRLSAYGLLASMLLFGGCSNQGPTAEEYEERGEWIRAIVEYRKLVNDDPTNPELKLKLHHLELRAANLFYRQGMVFIGRNELDSAITQFRQGMIAQPSNDKLGQALKTALARKEASTLYKEGMRQYKANNKEAARQRFTQALEVYPDHKKAAQKLKDLAQPQNTNKTGQFVLSSTKPITLNFRNTDLKAAFEFIGKSFGVNVIYDEDIQDEQISLFADGVTFYQALDLINITAKTFVKKVGPNTLLIAPDTADKHGQYEDFIVRTFHLNTVRAKDMLQILKGVITPKKVIINEKLNTVIIRDTEKVLNLADRLIQLNDRKPAETIVDVEIIEVNRSKSERLGFDFGSEITATFEPTSISGSIPTALKAGTVTLPAFTFRYFKQDVDAKTLANPKIRVIDGRQAKIHIGDRVPLRSSTVQDSTGQTRTTFVYTDIGIRLAVNTTIHLDNSVLITLGLEVSTLGQNLGTPDEPAFAIGTRNAETIMLLRDDETAILGGLIRDEERNSRVQVPGLGDVPALGALFRSTDESAGRTDILLTITPRVIRPWELPSKNSMAFYSGNANKYLSKGMFASLDAPVKKASTPLPTIQVGKTEIDTIPGNNENIPEVPPKSNQALVTANNPLLSFSDGLYEKTVGQEFEIEILAEGLADTKGGAMTVLYNPAIMEVVGEATPASSNILLRSSPGDQEGSLLLSFVLNEPPESAGPIKIGSVFVKGKKPGVSYLIYRSPKLEQSKGEKVDAEKRASRVVIKQ